MKDLLKYGLLAGGVFFLLKDQIMDALGMQAGTVQPTETPVTETPPTTVQPTESVANLSETCQQMVRLAGGWKGLNWDQWMYYYTIVTGAAGLPVPTATGRPFNRETDTVPVMTIYEVSNAIKQYGINLSGLRRRGLR